MTGLYVAAGLVVLLAILLWRAHHAGAKSARADAAESALAKDRKAKEIDDAVADLDSAALDDELRDTRS